MNVCLCIIIVVVSALVGAFWNRLIERMPFDKPLLEHERCPYCESKVSVLYSIPILGFLLLRGKFSCCNAKIPYRRLFIELLTIVLALLSYFFFVLLWGKDPFIDFTTFIAFEWLILTLIPICIIDFKYHLLPDSVTIGGIVLGIILSLLSCKIALWESILGALFSGGGLYLFSLAISKILKKEAMGFGDVKLLAGFGAIMGAPLAFETLIFASLLGILIIYPVRLFFQRAFSLAKETGAGEFPFGPFLGVAAVFTFIFGETILYWYLSMFEI